MAEPRAALWSALELVGDALREIWAHRLRSLLTLSGIVFGAASLVAMTSLARAMKQMAYADLEATGFPRSFIAFDRGPPSDAATATELRHTGLRLADIAALRTLPGVTRVLGRNFGGEYVVGGPVGQRRVRVDGVDAGYLETRHLGMVSGRSLRPLDVAHRARVVVVGAELVTDLFGQSPPVGRTLTIDGVRFLVVGVVSPIPFQVAPVNFDWAARRIYVPYTYLTRYVHGAGRVDMALVTAADTADFATVLQAGRVLLRQRHQGSEDFEIENEAANVQANLAMADGILAGWNGVMYTIAAVTLLVGGIGLFSVLLISVRERVREIGIRKALGADDGAILQLFLAESLTLAGLGALLGVGGGAGLILVTEIIGRQFGKAFAIGINPPGVVLAIGFSLIVGLLFGWYPARRAARLDPIEAISG